MNGFDHTEQDIDVFFIGATRSQFKRELTKFERTMGKKVIEKKEKSHMIEFVVNLQNRSPLKVQFIFNQFYRNVSKILSGFDIDIVQIGLVGEKLLCTLSFMQAARTKTFINYKLTNDIRDVPYYLPRCFKYMIRGFQWLMPKHYDENLAQMPMRFCNAAMIDYRFRDFHRNVDVFDIQWAFVSLASAHFALTSPDA